MLTDKSYARSLKAPKKAKIGLTEAKTHLGKGEILPFYDAIFKTLQEYLGDRFNLPKGSLTANVVEDRLRPSGCDEKILNVVSDVFSKCEMARYASTVPKREECKDVMKEVRKIIDYMERVKL